MMTKEAALLGIKLITIVQTDLRLYFTNSIPFS